MDVVVEMTSFGMEEYVIGGLLIGIAVAFAYLASGITINLSSIYGLALSHIFGGQFFDQMRIRYDRHFMFVFAGGMILGGFLVSYLLWGGSPVPVTVSALRLFLGGILIGLGASLAHGCFVSKSTGLVTEYRRGQFVASVAFVYVAVLSAIVIHNLIGV